MKRYAKYIVIILIIIGGGYKIYMDHYNKNNSFRSIEVTFVEQDLKINAKLAESVSEREQGLMNVKSMPENEGMVFVFPVESRQYFWMKNTLIPLDMIFLGPDLKVRHIHKNAKPMDETLISSILPTKYVVEVNSGFVEKHKIDIGQKLDIKF